MGARIDLKMTLGYHLTIPNLSEAAFSAAEKGA